MIWLPENEPKAILQITHGMTEHMGRYERLALELTKQGIVVAGFDLKGHGTNGELNHTCASFGENGWDDTLEDMHQFYLDLDKQFPNLPHFMLGFSLGSFLLREYIGRFNDSLAGAIIIGTGYQPGFILNIIMKLVQTEIKKCGFNDTTSLVQKLSFETYNQKFKPNRTKSDWLCSDNTQLDIYLDDALRKESISAGLFWQLLCAMKRTGKTESYEKWNKEIPVLLLSGQQDPVGDMGKGVLRVKQHMEQARIQTVTMKLFPNVRHDLLHEEESGVAEEVRKIILDWVATYGKFNV